ncbi:zinc finger protein 830 isoform X2 [Thamnophis elegans]|uniref:zinc finger protein 830 isoform X2 n=1 Tax=Thamnophis elegans TaxID=35005 RepID=UPI001378022C|nr:zinc finger protein 830 isoform X2 [Thamnophis elegans]
MATSSSGRQSRRSVNTLGQEELRRLMRAKQRESTAGKRKIDSPYVRYNSLGNLSCCLCNVTVKNELLWQTHVLGKQHKENIKYSTSKSFTETSSPLKKKKLEPRILDQKKGQDCNDHQPQAVSSNLPKTFFDKIEQTEVEIISSKSSSVVLLGNYKTEEGKKEDMTKEIRERDSKTSLPTPAQYELSSDLVPKAELVACSSTDYLENNALATPQLSHSESVQKAEPQEKNHQRRENTAEALPEGFFDDPEVDAKVRKVDTPKDQMDKEWDEFQKAMRQINTISEAIVAEEDEEGRLDRQIGEIDEQIECFRRVEQLRDRQEIRKDQLKEAMSQTVTQTKEDDDIDSNDEDELQDLLSQDWRAKGTIL